MSEKYEARNPEGINFITITVADWVDLFTRPIYKHIVIDSLSYCQKHKDLLIYACVIMTSYLHLIVKAEEYKYSSAVNYSGGVGVLEIDKI